MNPGIFGQSPSNVLIYGKTGTGKSLCAKYVSRRLVEIDKLDDDDILMQLSRAGEAGKLTSCTIGVLGISNKIKYKDRMDERESDERDGFRTTRIYDVYGEICRQVGAEPLSLRRVRDLLKEHAFLDVVEQSRHSGGSAEGSYTEHTLLEDPEVVKTVLSETVG